MTSKTTSITLIFAILIFTQTLVLSFDYPMCDTCDQLLNDQHCVDGGCRWDSSSRSCLGTETFYQRIFTQGIQADSECASRSQAECNGFGTDKQNSFCLWEAGQCTAQDFTAECTVGYSKKYCDMLLGCKWEYGLCFDQTCEAQENQNRCDSMRFNLQKDGTLYVCVWDNEQCKKTTVDTVNSNDECTNFVMFASWNGEKCVQCPGKVEVPKMASSKILFLSFLMVGLLMLS